MVVKGYSNSLILLSKAGLGKTTLLMNTMKELKLEKDINYIYCNNYITPLQLFRILQDVNVLQEPNILILDDVEMILKDKMILGLFKGALWEAGGKRIVNYNSSTPRIKDTQIDDFKGKIIFLLNEFLPDNELIKALKDRGLYYELKMNNEEILEFMKKEIIPKEFNGMSLQQRQKVFNYVKEKVYESNYKNLSYRTLIKSFQMYLCNPNHWKSLVDVLINS